MPARDPVNAGGGQRLAAVTASALAAMAGGAMDAWVYLAHGHVFANAQTGNVVLMGVALAAGDLPTGIRHLPPLLAFIAGLLISQALGQGLKVVGLNSRAVRLSIECGLLVALGLVARSLPDRAITASVGFIAALQSTSLSHIGSWTLNTGVTTGNLRSSARALVEALSGKTAEWPHALVMFTICLAFAAGAAGGGWLTSRIGDATPIGVAGLIVCAILAGPRGLDPIPGWDTLS